LSVIEYSVQEIMQPSTFIIHSFWVWENRNGTWRVPVTYRAKESSDLCSKHV